MVCINVQPYLADHGHGFTQLRWAFRCLGTPVTAFQLEQWASLIVQAISGPGRYFHGPEHSFRLAHQVTRAPDYWQDGLAVLAALFHDTVYYNIDGGLPSAIATLLAPLLDWQGNRFKLKFPLASPPAPLPAFPSASPSASQDAATSARHRLRCAQVVTQLFGLEERGETSWGAAEQNEYLSALWASQLLAQQLSLAQVAELAVAIEATIPFRPSCDGKTQGDRRYQRLQQANQQFQLGLSAPELRRAIQRSVHLTNCDLASFAAEDPTYFLDQTWMILPELNPALRQPSSYSIVDYRLAIQRMEAFMERLNAEQIFQRFEGTPSLERYTTWCQQAQYNLQVARLYLTAKVVASGLIEALEQSQGSSPAPLTQKLGSLSNHNGQSDWERRFPALRLSHPVGSILELKALQIAEEGRITPCAFDCLRSPLSAFLIRSIGFDRIHQLRSRMDLFFNQDISAHTLLRSCEAKVVQATSQVLQPSREY